MVWYPGSKPRRAQSGQDVTRSSVTYTQHTELSQRPSTHPLAPTTICGRSPTQPLWLYMEDHPPTHLHLWPYIEDHPLSHFDYIWKINHTHLHLWPYMEDQPHLLAPTTMWKINHTHLHLWPYMEDHPLATLTIYVRSTTPTCTYDQIWKINHTHLHLWPNMEDHPPTHLHLWPNTEDQPHPLASIIIYS